MPEQNSDCYEMEHARPLSACRRYDMPSEQEDFQMEGDGTVEMCLVCVMCPCICLMTRLESRVCALSIVEEVLLSTVHNSVTDPPPCDDLCGDDLELCGDGLAKGKVDCPLMERSPNPTPSPVTNTKPCILNIQNIPPETPSPVTKLPPSPPNILSKSLVKTQIPNLTKRAQDTKPEASLHLPDSNTEPCQVISRQENKPRIQKILDTSHNTNRTVQDNKQRRNIQETSAKRASVSSIINIFNNSSKGDESSNKTSKQEYDYQDSKIRTESRIKTKSMELKSSIKTGQDSKTSKEYLVKHSKNLKPLSDKKPSHFDKKETGETRKTPLSKQKIKKPVKQRVKERETETSKLRMALRGWLDSDKKENDDNPTYDNKPVMTNLSNEEDRTKNNDKKKPVLTMTRTRLMTGSPSDNKIQEVLLNDVTRKEARSNVEKFKSVKVDFVEDKMDKSDKKSKNIDKIKIIKMFEQFMSDKTITMAKDSGFYQESLIKSDKKLKSPDNIKSHSSQTIPVLNSPVLPEQGVLDSEGGECPGGANKVSGEVRGEEHVQPGEIFSSGGIPFLPTTQLETSFSRADLPSKTYHTKYLYSTTRAESDQPEWRTQRS